MSYLNTFWTGSNKIFLSIYKFFYIRVYIEQINITNY